MSRYRDKETGEVVQFAGAVPEGILVFRRNAYPKIYTKHDFDNRFEPTDEREDNVSICLWQARYVLRNLHAQDQSCGYDKLAAACERAAVHFTADEPEPKGRKG